MEGYVCWCSGHGSNDRVGWQKQQLLLGDRRRGEEEVGQEGGEVGQEDRRLGQEDHKLGRS